jgi:hypothetical protein
MPAQEREPAVQRISVIHVHPRNNARFSSRCQECTPNRGARFGVHSVPGSLPHDYRRGHQVEYARKDGNIPILRSSDGAANGPKHLTDDVTGRACYAPGAGLVVDTDAARRGKPSNRRGTRTNLISSFTKVVVKCTRCPAPERRTGWRIGIGIIHLPTWNNARFSSRCQESTPNQGARFGVHSQLAPHLTAVVAAAW